MTRRATCLVIGLVILGAACDTLPTPPDTPPQTSLDEQLRLRLRNSFVIPIAPMPTQPATLVDLGQALMFDKILSGNRDVSCATCHHPTTIAADLQSLSIGTGGSGVAPSRTLGPGREFVSRNSPTLINVGLGLPYIFWDGRVQGFFGFVGPIGPGPVGPLPPPPGGGRFITPAGDQLPPTIDDILVAQAMFPVLNRHEMRGKAGDLDRFGQPNELAQLGDSQFIDIWRAVTARLVAIPEYVTKFAAAFPGVPAGALSFEHAARAIAAFEKQAFTRTNSAFDRYLGQDNTALTTEQKRGALLFFGEARCSSCHNGPFLGGQSFANVGVPQLGPGTGRGAPLDFGFGDRIDQPFYQFAFRVAPLRNIELTAPYMHNGAYATLDAVVHHYSDVRFAQSHYDVTQLAPELRGTYHGDQATIDKVLATVDQRVLQRAPFTDVEIAQLVAFLKALTDPAARDLSSIVPATVPSGLPVRE
jgi:cytochrome c peroxidase